MIDQTVTNLHLDVSENSGTPKSSILIGFSIIFTIHFGGVPPIFGNTHFALFRVSDLWKVQVVGDEAMQSWMQFSRPCDAPVEQPEEVGLNTFGIFEQEDDVNDLINQYIYMYILYIHM